MESILNYIHLAENTIISCYTTNGYFQKLSSKNTCLEHTRVYNKTKLLKKTVKNTASAVKNKKRPKL